MDKLGKLKAAAAEIIDLYQNERKILLKILNYKTSTGKTLWMLICEDGKLLNILLNGVLDITDSYRLCKVKDNEEKNTFWYMFKREEYINREKNKRINVFYTEEDEEEPQYTKWLIRRFTGSAKLLISLLKEKTVGGKSCFELCPDELIYDIYAVIDSMSDFNDLVERYQTNLDLQAMVLYEWPDFYKLQAMNFKEHISSDKDCIEPPFRRNEHYL